MNSSTVGSGSPMSAGAPKVPSTLSVLPVKNMNSSEATIRTCPAITSCPAHPFWRMSPAAMKASTANMPSLATELATNGNSAGPNRP